MLTSLPTAVSKNSAAFSSAQQRWRAVSNRDPAADGAFVYSVRTTGVYCRPTCPARLALRRNVRFHATWQAAEQAGFRPCKRCRPNGSKLAERHAAIVVRACRLIETAEETTSLDDLARAVGMSRHHFHRMFKAQTGLTPKRYAAAHRARTVRGQLARGASVAEAIYDAGIRSHARFYATSSKLLGMTPAKYRSGGAGTVIRFAVGECSLGSILVAASQIGICSIALGDDPHTLVRDLQDRFSQAELKSGDAQFERWVAQVIGFVERPSMGLDLPLDVRGTAFQERVWQALCQISCGQTISYTELASRIGQPRAVRAVAKACAANQLAVAIPCHRVVRTDGSLSGYRWGVERKRSLLTLESARR